MVIAALAAAWALRSELTFGGDVAELTKPEGGAEPDTDVAQIPVGPPSGRIARPRFVSRGRTLIVGGGRMAREVASRLERCPQHGLEVIGFLDDDPLVDALGVLHEGRRTLGGTSGLESVVRAHDVDRVVFASSRLPASEQIHLFQRCIELGV